MGVQVVVYEVDEAEAADDVKCKSFPGLIGIDLIEALR